MDRKRLDSSTRTFIELDDRTESQEGAAERGSIASQTSQTPIHEKSVPCNAMMGYGCEAKFDVKDVEDLRIREGRSEGIMMTKTVDQSRQPWL
jgi:hypothetical protein